MLFGGLLFCITHALLSPLFFYLVDCVQRRYNSRSVLEIHGVLHTYPNLGITILISLALYSGLPGTLKFISEFYIFIGLLETAPLTLTILIFIANYIGLLGVLKSWYNIIFGLKVRDQKKIGVDLTFKEFFILYLIIGLLVFLQTVVNFVL
jgi:NADH:ubiquinone oxidoreductase subunit 4 (subunit M)